MEHTSGLGKALANRLVAKSFRKVVEIGSGNVVKTLSGFGSFSKTILILLMITVKERERWPQLINMDIWW